MKIIVFLSASQPDVVDKILDHLDMRTPPRSPQKAIIMPRLARNIHRKIRMIQDSSQTRYGQMSHTNNYLLQNIHL
jgi:hypothetical protein